MSIQDGNHHHQFSYLCLPPDLPWRDGGNPLQNPRRPQRNGAQKPSKYTRSPDRQKSFRFVILVLKSNHLDVTIIQHHPSWQVNARWSWTTFRGHEIFSWWQWLPTKSRLTWACTASWPTWLPPSLPGTHPSVQRPGDQKEKCIYWNVVIAPNV